MPKTNFSNIFNIEKVEYVSCEKCKHIVEKIDAKIVEGVFVNMWGNPEDRNYKIYYCPACKPNYDSIFESKDGIIYFKKFRVNEKGEIF